MTGREGGFQEGPARGHGREAGRRAGLYLGYTVCAREPWEMEREGRGGCFLESSGPPGAEFLLKPVGSEHVWRLLNKGTRFPICPSGGIARDPQKLEGSGPRPADTASNRVSAPESLRRMGTKKGRWDLSALLPGDRRESSSWHRRSLPAGRLPGRHNRGCPAPAGPPAWENHVPLPAPCHSHSP